MKRFWAVFLTLALMLGVNAPTAGAADDRDDEDYQYWYENVYLRNALAQYTCTDWVISDDYSQITVDGKTYPLNSILYREADGNYRFWNWWIDYLLAFRWQEQYTPDQWSEEVISSTREAVERIAGNFPSEEIILINGRPWQDTEWAEEYLSLLPAEYRETAKDQTVNGWLREASVYGVPVEQVRTWPRTQIPVRLERYRGYHTIDDFIADGADFSEFERPKEEIRIAAGVLFDKVPGFGDRSDAAAEDAASGSMITNNRIRMVMYLNDPTIQVTQFIGTPLEHTMSMELDQSPIAPNGHTLIPVRAFAEAFGIMVKWSDAAQTAHLWNGRVDVYLTAGFKTVNVITHPGNVEKSVPIDEPVRVVNGRTLIPLRFVAETFGFDVSWDGASQQITIEGDVDLMD